MSSQKSAFLLFLRCPASIGCVKTATCYTFTCSADSTPFPMFYLHSSLSVMFCSGFVIVTAATTVDTAAAVGLLMAITFSCNYVIVKSLLSFDILALIFIPKAFSSFIFKYLSLCG